MTRSNDSPNPPGLIQNNKVLPRLELDPDKYRKHLGECDLTEAQQNEVLQVLWQIMSTMVDIGWGVDSVQMFLPDLFKKASMDSDKLLKHNDTPLSDNNNVTAISAARKDSAYDI